MMDIELPFKKYQKIVLEYNQEVEESVIKGYYYYEGRKTKQDAIECAFLDKVVNICIKECPEFSRLSKKKKIELIQKKIGENYV